MKLKICLGNKKLLLKIGSKQQRNKSISKNQKKLYLCVQCIMK